MNLNYDFQGASIYGLEDLNSSFAKGSLKVMYTGVNRNHSCITREVAEAALPSLINVPIVCHWDSEAEEIGGHDMELAHDSDGRAYIRNLTEPCGVVPESASFSFVKEEDENGNSHEYLVADGVILWKRQDVYRHIAEDLNGRVNHSMEINVTDSSFSKDSGVHDIKAFEFTALCLLEAYKPCFEGSELSLYSLSNFKEKMNEMMAELRETYTLVNTSDEADNKDYSEEGGKVLEEKLALIAEFGLDAETLEFSIEEYSVEELREKLEAMKFEEEPEQDVPEADPAAEPEPAAEPAPLSDEPEEPASEDEGDEDMPRPSAYALNSNIREELCKVVSEEKVEKPWGFESRYWMVDFDTEASEVYVFDAVDGKLYGIPYSMNGDAVTVSSGDKRRKKYAIVDWVDGDADFALPEVYGDAEAKYAEISAENASMKTELEALRQFKLDAEASEKKAQIEAVFAEFQDLDGVEAFEMLKENYSEMDAEAVEEKCYALRGRMSAPAKFSLQGNALKLKVEPTAETKRVYGGLFEQYGHAAE